MSETSRKNNIYLLWCITIKTYYNVITINNIFVWEASLSAYDSMECSEYRYDQEARTVPIHARFSIFMSHSRYLVCTHKNSFNYEVWIGVNLACSKIQWRRKSSKYDRRERSHRQRSKSVNGHWQFLALDHAAKNYVS